MSHSFLSQLCSPLRRHPRTARGRQSEASAKLCTSVDVVRRTHTSVTRKNVSISAATAFGSLESDWTFFWPGSNQREDIECVISTLNVWIFTTLGHNCTVRELLYDFGSTMQGKASVRRKKVSIMISSETDVGSVESGWKFFLPGSNQREDIERVISTVMY